MGKPTIRFEGYTDDWEQRKLSEISDVRDGTHDSPSYLSDGHPFVTSKNVKDGYINYDDVQYISDEDFEAINKRSKVDMNDILMGMIGTIGNLALIRTEPDFAIKNVALIKDTKQVSYMYLYHYLQSSSAERQLLSGLDGGTQKFVSLKNIRELNIMVPSEAEQLKVGNFIESLDHLITLHHRKCEETKKLKKFMLQKMFPKKGEKVPDIRFDGFTDDWEQRKLGELGSLKNGMNFSKEAMGIGFPFVNLQNIFGNNVIDVTNLGKAMASDSQLKDYNLLNGDVLFVRSSVKLEGVGEAALVPQNLENTTYSGFIIRFRDEYGLDNNFKRFLFGIESVRNQIMAQATNSANKNISQTVLENLCLKIPNKSEQEKIGLYFSDIDHLINLHQHKCEELQNIKKFMLQNMFT